MSQVYFSTSNMAAGASVSTTLPTANADGTGSCTFLVRWFRDSGKASINDLGANLVITQGSFTLLSVNNGNMWAGPGAGIAAIAPNPAGGAITITNNGPGKITGVSIGDPDR